ncbi:ribosome-recycling factor, mitochondrial isoform X2 [Patella vulgata]|uniref:ribosome-recycling factor, mitochondrial isoform X2 n=1 Tax=Patella vulgata TaxID=6465 RepID=UPI00218024AB|nr:ribosome-recycling factor, mitochondrial isoform X2 [Patella vulgata]
MAATTIRNIAPILSGLRNLRCVKSIRFNHLSARCTAPSLYYTPSTISIRDYATKKAKKEKASKVAKKNVHVAELSEADMEGVLDKQKLENDMRSVLEELHDQFIHQLTVRTNPGVFEGLVVETPDGKFPLNHIAQIVLKNPSLLLINLSSTPQYISAAEEAIKKSGLNVNPQIDSTTIFIPLPKVTKEHRENLAHNAKTLAEKSKVKLRDVHGKYVRKIRACKDSHSEDLIHDLQEMVLDMMHSHTQQIDALVHAKKKDLLGEK